MIAVEGLPLDPGAAMSWRPFAWPLERGGRSRVDRRAWRGVPGADLVPGQCPGRAAGRTERPALSRFVRSGRMNGVC
jgi:hypothetical protein